MRRHVRSWRKQTKNQAPRAAALEKTLRELEQREEALIMRACAGGVTLYPGLETQGRALPPCQRRGADKSRVHKKVNALITEKSRYIKMQSSPYGVPAHRFIFWQRKVTSWPFRR
jgi:hypothetical protein